MILRDLLPVMVGLASWLNAVAPSAWAADSSGSAAIDAVRQKLVRDPTTASDYQQRALLLYDWLGALQQQGADTRPFLETDRDYYRLEAEVAREQSAAERDAAVKHIGAVIDHGYAVMEDIQMQLRTTGPIAHATPADQAHLPPARGDWNADWPMFQGNEHHTGYTTAPGPRYGRLAWKFPVGLGWYSRPVIEGDRVYLAAPGMRTICSCLDLATGTVIWNATQTHPLLGIYKYPAIASTPLVRSDDIVLREVNSHGGNEGQARNLVFLDKATGEVRARHYAGHIDYRTRYAPVAADGDYVVYPFGVHDIYNSPPVCQNFTRLICANRENTRQYWDVNIGDIDALAEPVLADGRAFCGTMEGYVYALRLGPARGGDAMAWSFKADGAVNTSVAVQDGKLYFGANDGSVYCLDAQSGRLRWRAPCLPVQPAARKLFTTPALAGARLYVGSANRQLYCLDAATGKTVWSRDLGDWIRSRPVVLGDGLYAATIDGRLHAFDQDGTPRWTKAISTHPLYADLAGSGDDIVASDSNLYAYCLGSRGELRWKHSLLPAFTDRDGNRIFTDQLSGGTYYQSKPTAYQGRIYFGTPSGFLFAVDARSGRELWKFEMGGAISVGPACADGRVYAGQQGGERFFYCLDAATGALVWKQTLPGGWVWGSATVNDGRVYVPTVNGYATCLEAATGHIIWMYPTAKSIPAEPAIDDDLVYFGSWSRSLYAFDQRSGDIVWKQNGIALDSGTLIAYQHRIYVPNHANIFSSFDTGTGALLSAGNEDAAAKGDFANFNATPAFHEGRAFFSARGGTGLRGVPLFSTVYCVDPATAKILWTHNDGGGLSAPAIANGRVYIGSGNSPFFYCLDEASGKELWTYKLGHRVEEATLCIYQDRVFVLAADGFVHAIE